MRSPGHQTVDHAKGAKFRPGHFLGINLVGELLKSGRIFRRCLTSDTIPLPSRIKLEFIDNNIGHMLSLVVPHIVGI